MTGVVIDVNGADKDVDNDVDKGSDKDWDNGTAKGADKDWDKLEEKGSDSQDPSRPVSAQGQGLELALAPGLGQVATVPPPPKLSQLKKQISGTLDFSSKSDRPDGLEAMLDSIGNNAVDHCSLFTDLD